VPAGKNAWQGPVAPLAAIVQLVPAGVDVIVPWPLPPGMIAIVPVAPGAGAGAACVQPLRNAGVGVPEPSTSTMQSAGAGVRVLLDLEVAVRALAPSATPSTVIVRFASAVPLIRSCVPFSSAREMLTAAAASEGTIAAAATATVPATAIRRLRVILRRFGCPHRYAPASLVRGPMRVRLRRDADRRCLGRTSA
jgi:hypothetical protein